jgi:hypothetical protein
VRGRWGECRWFPWLVAHLSNDNIFRPECLYTKKDCSSLSRLSLQSVATVFFVFMELVFGVLQKQVAVASEGACRPLTFPKRVDQEKDRSTPDPGRYASVELYYDFGEGANYLWPTLFHSTLTMRRSTSPPLCATPLAPGRGAHNGALSVCGIV